MTETRKITGRVVASRQSLLDAGLIEPTLAERAAREAWDIEWERRRHAANQAMPEFIAALDAVTDPVARAVLDLHKAEAYRCSEEQDTEGYGPTWPCQTVETVAAVLGIPVPPDLHTVGLA